MPDNAPTTVTMGAAQADSDAHTDIYAGSSTATSGKSITRTEGELELPTAILPPVDIDMLTSIIYGTSTTRTKSEPELPTAPPAAKDNLGAATHIQAHGLLLAGAVAAFAAAVVG